MKSDKDIIVLFTVKGVNIRICELKTAGCVSIKTWSTYTKIKKKKYNKNVLLSCIMLYIPPPSLGMGKNLLKFDEV